MKTQSFNAMKTYSKLITIPNFIDRCKYLMCSCGIGTETFGPNRYLNQALYQHCNDWKEARSKAILRDSLGGDHCLDLATNGHPIMGRIIVHHINPITVDDVLNRNPILFDLDNLVCVSHNTHEVIHYGSLKTLSGYPVNRQPNDTCPWRNT